MKNRILIVIAALFILSMNIGGAATITNGTESLHEDFTLIFNGSFEFDWIDFESNNITFNSNNWNSTFELQSVNGLEVMLNNYSMVVGDEYYNFDVESSMASDYNIYISIENGAENYLVYLNGYLYTACVPDENNLISFSKSDSEATINNFVVIKGYIPDAPLNLQNTTGNFFVDWTWEAGNHTDTFCINLDGVWYNDTTITEINDTDMLPHSTSEIQIFAYNTTYMTFSTDVSDSVTLPNNPVILTDLADIDIYEYDLVTIDANFTELDGDTITFSCNRTDLFTDFSTSEGTGSWLTDGEDEGIYNVLFTADDGHGSVASQVVIINVSNYIVPAPVLSNTTGNFYVDWTWDAIEKADSYNVSLDGIWYNGTIGTEMNDTDMLPHSTSEIQILAYNETNNVLSDVTTDAVTLPNNPVILSNLVDIDLHEYDLVTVDAEYSDLDSDVATFSCNRTDLFTDFSTSEGTGSWLTDGEDEGIYNVLFTADDGYGSVASRVIMINVSNYVVPAPVLSNTSGNFYVNWTWDAIEKADSYNISVNEEWHNGTIDIYWNDTSLEAHGTSSIQIFAYNETYDVLSEATIDSVTLLNNPVNLTDLNDINIIENGLINLNANFTDVDGDSVVFSCNRTDLFTDFNTSTGEGSWLTDIDDEGTYYVLITADDGQGSVDEQVIVITIGNYVLATPVLSSSTGNFFADWTWDAIENADSYNVSLNGSWYNGTIEAGFTDSDMLSHGTSLIQVLAYNESYGVLSAMATSSVTLPNNPVVLTNLNDIYVYESDLVEVNADFTDLDGDDVTFTCNRTDLFSDFNISDGTGSWQTNSASSGVYEVMIYGDDGYGSNVSQTITITVNEYSIGGDENLSYVSGNFFVNWSWMDVEGADLYNVSENGQWVYNGTNTIYANVDMLPHESSNISIYGYNMTSDCLTFLVSNETQLQNNPVSLSNLSDVSVLYGTNITVDAEYFDLDGDICIFSCDRTDMFEDFNILTGEGMWATDHSDVGSYQVTFTADDLYGSIGSKTITITVNDDPVVTTTSSSSGGGGTGGIAGEDVENIESVDISMSSVYLDSPVDYDFNASEMTVDEISFDALQNLGTVKARVEVLYDQSSFADEIDGCVYQYINVWFDHYGMTDGVQYENAQISFVVDKDWIENNNIDITSLQLNWYDDDEYLSGWKAIATELTGSDEDCYYLTAEVSDFSCFAITGDSSSSSSSSSSGDTGDLTVKEVALVESSADVNDDGSYEVITIQDGENEDQQSTIMQFFISAKEFIVYILNGGPIEDEYEEGTFDWIVEE